MNDSNPNPKEVEDNIIDVRPYDILCGRGTKYCNHPGNRRFHSYVSSQCNSYKKAQLKEEKTLMSKSIVEALCKTVVSPSRFLVQVKIDNKKKVWRELSEKKAVEKTSQLLRELAYKGTYSTVYQKRKYVKAAKTRVKKSKESGIQQNLPSMNTMHSFGGANASLLQHGNHALTGSGGQLSLGLVDNAVVGTANEGSINSGGNTLPINVPGPLGNEANSTMNPRINRVNPGIIEDAYSTGGIPTASMPLGTQEMMHSYDNAARLLDHAVSHSPSYNHNTGVLPMLPAHDSVHNIVSRRVEDKLSQSTHLQELLLARVRELEMELLLRTTPLTSPFNNVPLMSTDNRYNELILQQQMASTLGTMNSFNNDSNDMGTY